MVGCLHIVSKFINHQSLLGSQTTFVGTRMVRAEKHNTVRRHPSQAKRVRVCVCVCVCAWACAEYLYPLDVPQCACKVVPSAACLQHRAHSVHSRTILQLDTSSFPAVYSRQALYMSEAFSTHYIWPRFVELRAIDLSLVLKYWNCTIQRKTSEFCRDISAGDK
jgi:hypothetical protein